MQPRLKGFNLWKAKSESSSYPWSWANDEYFAYSDRQPFGRRYWRKSIYGKMDEFKKPFYTFQLPGEFFC